VRRASQGLLYAPVTSFAMVVQSQDVPERVPDGPRVRIVALHADALRLQDRGGRLKAIHVELERRSVAFRTEGDLRNLGGPPERELAARRLDRGPHGAPLTDHPEAKDIAVERETPLHVVNGEDDVTDVLHDRHGPESPAKGYEDRGNEGFERRPKEAR